MKKQLLSILLVLVMVIGMIPVNAIAEDSASDSSQTESYGAFIDGEQVISDMIEKNGMYAHPRIIMSEEKFSNLRDYIGQDSVTAILLEKLRGEADRHMNEPVCQYEIPDGIRLLETSKRIQRRVAALAIGDEADARDIASEVLTYAYKESYAFVRRAYSAKDGTYSEGLGYWDYATYYLGLYSSALTSAAGTDYGLADHEGLRKSVDFVRYMSSNTPKSFSFGDDRESRDTGWAVLLWLAEYYQSYDIASTRLKKIENDSFNYLDLLWIDEEKTPDSASDSPTDWGEVGASNASFRNTWDESGIAADIPCSPQSNGQQ